MARLPTKNSLPPSFQNLVELMQAIQFGHIRDLRIEKGQPVLDPPPRVIREIKFGAENDSRSESPTGDFVLKSQVIELVEAIARITDGTIESLEIKHGLPFRMAVEAAAA